MTRDNRTPIFPRWLSWMFIAVMLYMVYAVSQSHKPAAPVASPQATPAVSVENYPALAEATDVEAWKRKLNPEYAATMNCNLDAPKDSAALPFKMIEETAGEGEGATCGETITLALTVWNQMGGKAFEGELPLALGSRQLASGLDYGLLGIKPGGVRMLTLPPSALARGKPSKEHANARKALPQNKVALVTVKRIKN